MAVRRIQRGARVCYVYIMESAGLLKVGWSDDPSRRIKDLQVGSPLPIRLLHALPCPSYDVIAIEAAAHKALAPYHVRGEWHDVEPLVAISAIADAFAARGVKLLTTEEVGRELARRALARATRGTPIQQAIAKARLAELL